MKVIILGTAWPYRGGLSAFNERIALEYAREGHEVEVVTFTLQYPSFLFPGKTQYSEEPAPKGIHIVRKLNAVNPFSWIKTGRYIRKKRPDLLITKFWLPFMAPALGTTNRISRWKGLRRVAILDNLIPHEHRIGDRPLARYFVRSVDAMVAMSQSVLKDCDQFDAEKKIPRCFCPHPLYDHYGEKLSKEEACKMLSLPTEGRYILFFGFIREYKGLDLLLQAMADERVKKSGAKLIVAGEFYGDSAPYLELIKKLGIEEHVILRTDFIPDHEVNRYFCAADIVAQPYKSATQSGVTQIAFHFEKPMLVTNVGGLPEIVPNGEVGFVVEPKAEEIAEKLTLFYEEDWAERLTASVRQEKKKYDWKNMTEAINSLTVR